jgi:hypothetical protein
MKTKKIKVDIDWVCHAIYDDRKLELIEGLRSMAMRDVETAFYACHERLQNAGKDTNSVMMSATQEMRKDNGETLFMFIGMLVNRDLPPGAIIFLAPTKKLIDKMGQTWTDVCEAKLNTHH